MRVLQINKYHYKRGGADAVYFNTTNMLKQHGHEVVNFAMRFNENVYSIDEDFFVPNNDYVKQGVFEKVKNTAAFFYSNDAEKNLLKLIKAKKPDIAHLHIFYGSLTSSILKVLKACKVPVVVSVHDYKLVCPNYLMLNGAGEICEKCLGGKYFNCVTNKCVKDNYTYSLFFALESFYRDKKYPFTTYIDRFIFVSNFSKNIHIKANTSIVEKAYMLYNFDPNISFKTPLYNNVRDYFLFAGRLSKEKGLNTLIETFRMKPLMKLKIAGTGPLKDDILKDLPGNVEYCGFQSGDNLEALIAGSACVIVPSEWYENNPMSVIETYALGRPVIGAEIGGIPEILVNGKTGFLFQSGSTKSMCSAIDNLMSLSDIEYLEMCKNAREFAEEKFDPETHYKKLMDIYKTVLVN